MTDIWWVDVLLVAAAVITAVGVLWRKFLRPMLRALEVASDALPILLTIAQEFQPNHGASLRDTIDNTRRSIDRVAGDIRDHIVEDRASFAQMNEELSNRVARLTRIENVAGEVRDGVEHVSNILEQQTTAIEQLNDLHDKENG